jgi:hypothetical protein
MTFIRKMRAHWRRPPIQLTSSRSTRSSRRPTTEFQGRPERSAIGIASAPLYYPGARLIPTATPASGQASQGKIAPQILDIEGFIARVEPLFKETGFYEKEIARRTEQFGNIAHVWSIYESRHNEDDPEPFMRGINSIQLFNDGKRWWIVNIYWQQESAENLIPEKYLE